MNIDVQRNIYSKAYETWKKLNQSTFIPVENHRCDTEKVRIYFNSNIQIVGL